MDTSPNIGLFTWYELLTTDTAGAKSFYGNIVGWGTQAFADPGMDYTMWTNTQGPIGGLMSLESAQQAGHPPYWLGTISIADIEATFARAVELGAKVHAPIHEIPKVGRFAVLADPTGAVFCLMQSFDPAPPLDSQELGRFSWHELWSPDPDAAWQFYRQLLGWVETGVMEMGPGMTYRMFGRTPDKSMGGIGMVSPGQPTAWLFYANVDDVDRAADRARELGAHIFVGPMDVPGGGRVFGGIDPQGAGFAVYSHTSAAS